MEIVWSSFLKMKCVIHHKNLKLVLDMCSLSPLLCILLTTGGRRFMDLNADHRIGDKSIHVQLLWGAKEPPGLRGSPTNKHSSGWPKIKKL